MISSRGLKGLFAVLLILTLSLKLPAHIHIAAELNNKSWIGSEIAAFLERHGFQVSEGSEKSYLSVMAAMQGDCRLLVAVVSPEGWHRDLIGQLASPNDQLFFVFRGTTYPDQPRWLTQADHYWSYYILDRLHRFNGRMRSVRPVLGVSASPGCDIKHIPWSEVAELPQA